jgi:hydroxymethylbilane synthase
VVQIAAQRPDLVIEPLRGNLDTRLRKLDAGQYDAIVLAAAGLVRLGLAGRIRARFDTGRMLPAAGQGALGIEVRADDAPLREALAALTDRAAWLAVHAERAVARGLGGSCSVPLAAFAQWQGDTLELQAALGDAAAPARALLRAQSRAAVSDEAGAEALGTAAAASLRAQGAASYLGAH